MEHLVVEVLPAPAGTGFSSDTVVFDALVDHGAGRRRQPLVARVQPAGYSLYREHDLETQWRVMDALHRCSDVPVPGIIAHDTSATSVLGTPFFVMDRVEGAAAADAPPYTVKGWLHDATSAQQRGAWTSGLEVLARIHAVDWHDVGLDFLLASTTNPVGLRPQQAKDDEFMAWVMAGREHAVLDAAAAWLRAHLPADGELVLSWGDARPGNMLFQDFRPSAVLDWEMVTLAARGADLGWWLVFNQIHTIGIGRPNLPGIPDDASSVAVYEELSGARVSDLHFYEVRAGLRAALLLMKYADALIAAGRLDPTARRQPYTPAVTVLEHLLA
jgi:aminoglycoside phosphotransferase (APT) family kinase protein